MSASPSVNVSMSCHYGAWGMENITALPSGPDSTTASGAPAVTYPLAGNRFAAPRPTYPVGKLGAGSRKLKANPDEYAPCPNCGGDDTSSSTYDPSASTTSSVMSAVRQFFRGSK